MREVEFLPPTLKPVVESTVGVNGFIPNGLIKVSRSAFVKSTRFVSGLVK
jgi:hypothetical protein